MTLDLSQFHAAFFEESFEALDSMERSLLIVAAGQSDPEVVNSIFRVTHSIKGGAATLGFEDITSLTHSLESLLDALRSQRLTWTGALVELLLRAVDLLREMLRGTQTGQPLDAQRSADLQFDVEVAVARASASAAGGVASAVAAPQRAAEPCSLSGLDDGRPWRIGFRPLPAMLTRGHDPVRLFAELARLGELEVQVDASAVPPLEDLDPQRCYLSWSLRLAGHAPRDGIAQVLDWVEADCEISIEREGEPLMAQVVAPRSCLAAPRPPTVGESTVAPESIARPEATSLRVSAAKLDELINDVGELVITQSMLVQIATTVTGAAGDRLRMGLAQLERNVRELQDAVMRARMVPISTVLSRLPRLVHDLAQQLGKQVELQMIGTNTEVDKTLLDKLGDSLMHLVRNALDHGLETPTVRRAAGKPDTGSLQIAASQRGGEVVVEVSDDGAGIDAARVLAKARSKGLISGDAAPSDAEVLELLFAPGFSTAETTTAVSGRGVGMDVVRSNIESLGGRVEIASEPGRGCRFSLYLPLTLAIVDGQMIRLGNETYIVPVMTIVESVRLRPGLIEQMVGHGEVMEFRGEYVPVLTLASLLDMGRPSESGPDLARGLIMVVEAEGRRVGLRIDGLLGQQQVVVKTLQRNFRAVDGIAGATILGDGSVALILDVAHFTRRTAVRNAA